VLVLAAVERHGVDGVILATALSGVVLLAVGFLRLGTFIKYIPYPVTVGFTAGIAVIIFASQLKELLGLTLGKEPGPLLPKLAALAGALPTLNPAAVAVAALTVGGILALRRWRPQWPAFIIAVGLAAVLAALLGLPVETIGSRFGGIPSSLPAPRLPELSAEKVAEVLPTALSFALLGGIESLLSAVVADSMSGRRHRSNCELVAQGAANIGAALFGGFCVTGTIARTATNVRSGARGRWRGCCTRPSCCCSWSWRAAGRLRAAGRARGRAGGGGVEHGGEARGRHFAAGLARRCRGAARHLRPGGVP
jgi:SulP family sulfate permease